MSKEKKGPIIFMPGSQKDQIVIPPDIQSYSYDHLMKAGDTTNLYLKLLGADSLPQTRHDLPKKLFLPPVLVGHLGQIIYKTLRDDQERSQVTGKIEGEDEIGFGMINIGDNEKAGILHFDENGNSIVGRPLSIFHMHNEDVYPLFSIKDIAQFMVDQNPPYFQLVGSSYGMYALLTTAEFESRQHGRRAQISKLENMGYIASDIGNSVSILERLGLGVYRWQSTHDQDIQTWDTKAGIDLKRI